MPYRASSPLKWAYVIVVLGAVVPIGLAGSGWVAAATGGGGLLGTVPLVGPLLFLVLGIYRVVLVVRVSGILDSYEVAGPALVLRKIGVFGLYVGALVSITNVVAGPLMKVLMKSRTESGVEYFIAGVYLSMFTGIGLIALILFEFGRLRGFEEHARVEPAAHSAGRKISGGPQPAAAVKR